MIPLAADQRLWVIKDQGELKRIKEKYKIKDKFIFYVGALINRRF